MCKKAINKAKMTTLHGGSGRATWIRRMCIAVERESMVARKSKKKVKP